MNLPKVIVHNIASLDGRLTLAPNSLLLFGDPRWEAAAGSSDGVYRWVMQNYHPQALLEGSGSLVLPGQPLDPLPPVEGDPEPFYRDFLPLALLNRPGDVRWLAVIDSRGAIRWAYKEFPGEDWAGWHVLVLAARRTPAAYLAYLQREAVPYLVVGEERVDLKQALQRLAEMGVQTIVSTGGGRLNGALLRQGLVDEITVEFFPAVIGSLNTPSLFDAAPLQPEEQPVRLDLLNVETLADGKVRLHYRVRKEVI